MIMLSTFLENMYWIDLIIVIVLLFISLIFIRKNTRKILEKNKKYNTELLAMRTEIYTEYEKNFFLG